MLIETHDH